MIMKEIKIETRYYDKNYNKKVVETKVTDELVLYDYEHWDDHINDDNYDNIDIDYFYIEYMYDFYEMYFTNQPQEQVTTQIDKGFTKPKHAIAYFYCDGNFDDKINIY